MEVILGLFAFLGATLLVIGGLLCISHSMREAGKLVATGGAAALVFVVSCALFLPALTTKGGQPSPSAQVADNTPPKPAQLTKSDILKNIRIGGFRWDKSGFGSIMIATFVLYNDNQFPIKDVEVTCTHRTKSETVIDRNARTVYEVVSQRGYQSVVDMNMGFIHSKADSSTCAVTNFSRV